MSTCAELLYVNGLQDYSVAIIIPNLIVTSTNFQPLFLGFLSPLSLVLPIHSFTRQPLHIYNHNLH